MNLYEIDREIMSCVDQDTGEILDVERLDTLQMARKDKLEGVALWIKNLEAEAEAIKAEKNALAEREASKRKKADSLREWLTAALEGVKMETARVTISFRKSEPVVLQDESAFVVWAVSHHADLLTVKPPVPNKTAIKAAIKGGEDIPGAAIETRQNIQIK